MQEGDDINALLPSETRDICYDCIALTHFRSLFI